MNRREKISTAILFGVIGLGVACGGGVGSVSNEPIGTRDPESSGGGAGGAPAGGRDNVENGGSSGGSTSGGGGHEQTPTPTSTSTGKPQPTGSSTSTSPMSCAKCGKYNCSGPSGTGSFNFAAGA